MQKFIAPEDALEAMKFLAASIYTEAQQSPPPTPVYDFSKVDWKQLHERFKFAVGQDGWRAVADVLADLYVEVKAEPAGDSARTFRRLSEKPEMLPDQGSGLVLQWTGGKLHLLMSFPPPAVCAGLRYTPHLGELDLFARDVGASSGGGTTAGSAVPTGFKGPVKDMIAFNPLLILNPIVLARTPNANVKTVYCEIRPVTAVPSAAPPSPLPKTFGMISTQLDSDGRDSRRVAVAKPCSFSTFRRTESVWIHEDKGRMLPRRAETSTLERSFFDPNARTWMTLDETLDHLQLEIPVSRRIVHMERVLKDVERLEVDLKALSPDGIKDNQPLVEVLVSRDRKRFELVQLHDRISELIALAPKEFENRGILVDLKPMAASIELHRLATRKFPLPPSSFPVSNFPFQQAQQFIKNFVQEVIFPAAEARRLWKELASKLQLKSRFGTSVLEAETSELAAAEGKAIESALHLRHQYDECIPLLRFCFPELRSCIRNSVDEHCGLGALRFDVSSDDFQLTPVGVIGPSTSVFRASTKETACATKKILKREYCMKRLVSVDDFFREMEAMRRAETMTLHHQNVAEVEFAFEEGQGGNKFYYMAMPWYPMSSDTWFAAHGGNYKNLQHVIRVLSETVSGLHCLHCNGIIHGDLKPDNIMMDGTGVDAHPKLIDFNYSGVHLTAAVALRVVTAPIGISSHFSPPEFTGANPQRTFESDVYSLGQTFGALLETCLASPDWSDSRQWSPVPWLKGLVSLMTVVAPERRLRLVSTSVNVTSLLESLRKIVATCCPEPSGRMNPSATQILSAVEPTTSFEWYSIGDALNGVTNGVTIDGTEYKQQQCYMRALELDPQLPSPWQSRATSLTIDAVMTGKYCSKCTCRICADIFLQEDRFFADCCTDKIVCRACALRHIQTELAKCSTIIHCPWVGDCTSTWPKSKCLEVMSEREIGQWDRLEWRQTSQAAGAVICRAADCRGMRFEDDLVFQAEPHHFICPVKPGDPDHEWCLACDAPWHEGSTCEQYQQWRQANNNAEAATREALRIMGAKVCRQCHNFVEKKELCNHMTCLCGAHFCNVCGEKLDPKDLNAHYGVQGKPCYGKLFASMYDDIQ